MHAGRPIWLNTTILLLMLVLLGACGTSSSSAPAPDASTPTPTSAVDATPPTVEPGLVVGHVTTPEGMPIAGVTIGAQPAGPVAEAIPEVVLYTNAEGTFQWPLPPGTIALSIQATGYRSQTQVVEVRAGQPITVTVVLAKQ